ncbi:holo-ACP synthase [Streptomyces sp. NPDC053048]|uniref:holo-ACP synthase n=1 Tax=Streptomyces sp. NPDC053048 TaxID=3365694 RepID=UPI0037D1E501
MALGIDLLHVDELARLLTRPWFRAYAYAPEELAVADSLGAGRAREFLAGRFAAKEAVVKALGTGARAGVVPRQVAVLRTAGGAPRVRLSGAAARRAEHLGLRDITVSITHKRGLVVAAAVGVPGDEPGAATVAGLIADALDRRDRDTAPGEERQEQHTPVRQFTTEGA